MIKLDKNYTLENIQVDCRELTEAQIDYLVDIYEKNNIPKYNGSYDRMDIKGRCNYIMKAYNGCHWFSNNETKYTTITYEKFIELFGNKEKVSNSTCLKHDLSNVLDKATEIAENIAYKETDNKLNYELDFNFITQLAERMNANKGKYEPYNWQKLDNVEELKQALFRHVIEVMKGNYIDDSREFGHLEAIALNCMFINYQLNKKA